MRRFVDVKGATLTKQQSGSVAFFTLGTATFSAKLVDAEFPPYQQVIPSHASRVANVSRVALIDALKAVQLAAADRTGGVTLHFEASTLRVTSESPESGAGGDELGIEPDGPPFKAGMNAKYMLDALGAFEGETVALGVSGELDPIIVRPIGPVDFTGVLMPMRI